MKEVKVTRASDIKRKLREVVLKEGNKIIKEEERKLYRKHKSRVLNIIRETMVEEAPKSHKGVFRRVTKKSETRDIGSPKAGSGVRVQLDENYGIEISFYASNKEHKMRSQRYGYNEYWAVVTGIHGRRGYSKTGKWRGNHRDIIAIPHKQNGVVQTGANGKPISSYVTKVAAYKPSPINWFDRAVEKMTDRIAEDLRRG